MTTAIATDGPPRKPYVMVVGVDFGKLADRAFVVGYAMSRLHPLAELHVLSVVSEAPDAYLDANSDPVAPKFTLEEASRRLSTYVDALLDTLSEGRSPNVRVISHVMLDAPVLAITNLARELEADMIVVGTHGRRGLARWLLGSVAEGILRHASCPVFAIPPPADETPPLVLDEVCPACVEARQQSDGRELWCEQHQGRQGRRYTHHRPLA
jgi:nucleotide-binding universal stress UspA family protein